MAARKKPTFEEQLAMVERLITQLESGGLSLEESIKQYEAGVGMLSSLEKELGSAMQRLTVIRQDANGNDTEETLEV